MCLSMLNSNLQYRFNVKFGPKARDLNWLTFCIFHDNYIIIMMVLYVTLMRISHDANDKCLVVLYD